MRILPISSTKFTGLFTDKTKENGNHWRMEYSPYSWESDNTSKMANKETFDVYDHKLPDNEEIYVNGYPFAESKDILGTTSYYLNKITSGMRRTITEVPAMNLEESLITRNKKLKKFLSQKEDEKTQIKDDIESAKYKFESADVNYRKYSEDYNYSFLDRARDKSENKSGMDSAKYTIYYEGRAIYNKAKDYQRITDSIESVRKTKAEAEKTIDLLKMARETDTLIDISRRDVEEPDNALVEALKDMGTAIKKTIALPHRIISVKEVVKMVGDKVESANVPEQCVKVVGELIKKKA